MVDQLNYERVEFPVSVKDYAKIEAQNNINVKNINVFGYENKEFYLIYVSKQKNDNMLNLLLITEGEKTHYVLIKDFHRSLFNNTKPNEKMDLCMHCFSSEEILNKQNSNRMAINGEQAITMPQKGKTRYSFKIIIDRCQFHL